MPRYDCVFLDLGGVVYVGDTPLPGAVDAIARLREAGIPLRFLTNTTRTPHGKLLATLRAMGLSLEDDELFTPALAARQLIEKEGLEPHLLIHPALEADFANLSPGNRKAVVVGDAGRGFTYDALNAAFRVLAQGARFLALANNRSFRDADGVLSLDAGPFVQALAYASGCEPIVLGKPAAPFFQAALDSVGCTPDRAVMVGDDVESDVAGAMAAGLAGILVQTGKYEEGAEDTIDPPPTNVCSDLAAATDWVLG